jgi:hypothetical protein
MDYKEKQDEYNKIMGRIGKNLKPIFDRMIDKQTAEIRKKTPVNYTSVMPSCGITSRNIPLTEEQLEMGDNLIDASITSMIDATEDYPDLINQVPSRSRDLADRGEGGTDKHRVRLIPLEFPQWLDDIKSTVKGYFVKKKARKGYDWEEMVKGRIAKAKEKITKEYSALYVFIDTSGSMQFNTDENGVPLLKLFSSYLPVIAEKYRGEVWQTTHAHYGDPDPIKLRTKLSDFTHNNLLAPTEKQFDTIGGGGTDFWGVFQYFDKKVREAKEKHEDAKVMLIFFSDMDENLSAHPELIHGKEIIFVTDSLPNANNDVMQYINGDNIKLITVNNK